MAGWKSGTGGCGNQMVVAHKNITTVVRGVEPGNWMAGVP